jgi:tetratricopeptide (TPR) repeat protein
LNLKIPGKKKMTDDTDVYTETMAKIYFEQGYFEKAAEIYRNLLKAEPDRRELIEAFAKVEDKISIRKKKTIKDLEPLLEEWIELMLTYNNVLKLKRLKEDLYQVPGTRDKVQGSG